MQFRKPKFFAGTLLIFCMLSLQSCQISRYVYYNYSDITDYEIFPYRTIETDSTQFTYPQAENARVPKHFITQDSVQVPFGEFLAQNETVAFIIIQNDSLVYENYFNGYSRESVVASFSMAKSITSILIGIAIEDGYIDSVNDPVTKYVPGMESEKFKDITIEHLLQMTSGIEFNESYTNPFGDAAAFYYGRNLIEKTKEIDIENPPGTTFNYTSGSAQILGLVLSKALPKDVTISDYLEENIWKPLGMQYNATWSLGEEGGLEKTFCCVNAHAIDFAKIGSLYLHQGEWKGRQLVPESWVKRSTKVDTTGASVWYYQYQWWLPTKNGDYTAQGLHGQYIYVNPNKDLVIVRLGSEEGDVKWMRIFPLLASYY